MARFDGKTNKQIATKMRIGEISGVTVPAHTGAAVSLFKCEGDLVKISFEEALDGLQLEDDIQFYLSQMFQSERALHHSISSILNNPEDYPNPREDIMDTLFAYAEAIASIVESGEIDDEPEEMTEDDMQQVERCFKKQYEGKEETRRRRRRRSMRKLDIKSSKAGVASTTKTKETDMSTADLENQVTTLKAQLATAIAYGQLSDTQKSFYETLDQASKEEFISKSATGRNDMIETAKAADPVMYTAKDGTEFRKSEAALANMAKRLDEQTEKNESLAKAAEIANFEKRASEELGNMPGTVQERAALLKAIDTIDDEEMRAKVMGTVKAKNEKMAGAFVTKGTVAGSQNTADNGFAKSAEDKLDSMAKAHQEKHNVPYTEAYNAVLATPEGESLYAQTI